MTGYLVITGLFFLVVGLRALIKPVEAVAVPYNLTAETTDSKNYLRSGAGGVTIACALVMLVGAFYAPLHFAAGIVAVTVLGGLLFGRAVSLAVDGSPGAVSWVSACFELMGFVPGVLWLLAS